MRRDRDIEWSSNRSAVRTRTLRVAEDSSKPQEICESVRLFVRHSEGNPRAKIKKQPPCQKVKLFKQCSNSLLLKELTDDVISLICGASGTES